MSEWREGRRHWTVDKCTCVPWSDASRFSFWQEVFNLPDCDAWWKGHDGMDGAVIQAVSMLLTLWQHSGEDRVSSPKPWPGFPGIPGISSWEETTIFKCRRKISVVVSSTLLVTRRDREHRRTLEEENGQIDIIRC